MIGFISNNASEYSENKDSVSPSMQKLSQGRSSKSQVDLDGKPSYPGSTVSAVKIIQ